MARSMADIRDDLNRLAGDLARLAADASTADEEEQRAAAAEADRQQQLRDAPAPPMSEVTKGAADTEEASGGRKSSKS